MTRTATAIAVALMASHAHGQGYMDLNFLIPEVVSSLQYRKGTFAAEDGDFVTTGSARIDYLRSLPAPFVEAGLGPHGHGRALAASSGKLGDWDLLGAFETSRYDGPWEQPEGLRRSNAVLRLSQGDADKGLALTAMAYRAHWRAGAYVIDYGLNLFSGPSGFINGPDGDQHEQADHRMLWGGLLKHSFSPRTDTEVSWGLQWRHDRIKQLGLYDTVDRRRTHTVREDRVEQDALGLFDRRANDIEYWGASCTRAEGPGCNGGDGKDGIEGRLTHPMEPRMLRVSLRTSF